MADQNDWYLGQSSQRYETGGQGASTISTGKGDRGGVSYGSYQLSSKMGTLQEYLDQSPYKGRFEGLQPTTPEFNAEWRELATTDPGFARDQHVFIKRTHYDVQAGRLKTNGLDLSDRGPAVQDALWSTSVQFRGLTPSIFDKGLQEKFGKDYKLSELSDKDIVGAVQDYKINHNQQLFSKSPKLWDGLLKRAEHEKADLLELAGQEKTIDRRGQHHVPDAHDTREVHSPHRVANGLLEQSEKGSDIRELQQSLNKLGYRDAQGHALQADGDFGKHTKEAVEAFQQAHGLKVDGIVGTKTQEALRQPNHKPQLTNPGHPDHALYEQALKAVHQAEEGRKIGPGTHSVNLAAALVVEVKREGITRVDRVELNNDGTLARAVQVNPTRDDPPLNKNTDAISTKQAIAQAVQESSEQLEQVNTNLQARQAAERNQVQSPAFASL